jgi:hypothetical protein
MDKKTYKIGGREFSPAVVTARQLKYVNRTIREAMMAAAIDANGNDNPLLLYAAVWTALVENEAIARFLAGIMVIPGSVWTEESAAEVHIFLEGQPMADLGRIYTEASTDFFTGNPGLTQNIFLSLTGYVKNSAQLVRNWSKSLEEASTAGITSTQQEKRG